MKRQLLRCEACAGVKPPEDLPRDPATDLEARMQYIAELNELHDEP